ncbi:MAG: SDR family NAD(P)-dependent oxidoreductase [Rhodospirillales bacterium]
MDLGLTGTVCLIVGAGSGIARETALLLGREGVQVAAADRDEAKAAATAAAIRDAGGKAAPLALDVTDPRSVAAAVAAVEAQLGPVDGLVNCAGIYQVRKVEAIGDDDWAQMLRIHAEGTFRTCRAVLPGMLARRRGAIVNTTSLHALRGQADAAHYAAAKGAILAFTKSLAREKAADGIRANMVAPGPIDTPLWRGTMTAEEIEQARRARSRIIPMGRLGEAREIAPAIAFLLSPLASYITGTVIGIDGGERMD